MILRSDCSRGPPGLLHDLPEGVGREGAEEAVVHRRLGVIGRVGVVLLPYICIFVKKKLIKTPH